MDDATQFNRPNGPFTLGIDIGGSHLKAAVLDADGQIQGERHRVDTPHPATPSEVCPALVKLAQELGTFDRVSVGFPGVVRNGTVLTAPNLDTPSWRGFALGEQLSESLGAPVRLLNDAEVAGLGVITGQGVEVVITLGTGMGFALFQNGQVSPHLELSHHPVRKGRSYDQYLGDAALDEVGRKHWNKRVRRAVGYIAILTNFDVLSIGGGNARHIRFDLPQGVRIVSNQAGITGGVKLWGPAMNSVFEPI
jgi:polyphosphate glucokinase